MKFIEVEIKDIKSYENNVKKHPDWQIEQIMDSIKSFGYNDPIAITDTFEIIEGHGRFEAIKRLGYTKIKCFVIDNLDDNSLKKYRLIHNQLTLNTDFDFSILESELNKLLDFNMESYGFTFPNVEINDNYLDIDYVNEKITKSNKLICPNCNYIADKSEFILELE